MSGGGRRTAEAALQSALPRELYVDEASWRREREAVLYGEWFCVGRRDDLGLTQSPSARRGRRRGGVRARHLRRDRGPARRVQRVPAPRLAAHPVDPSTPRSPCRSPARHRPSGAPTTPGPTGSTGSCCAHRTPRSPDPAAFALAPVGVETWGGFVFVHLTPDRSAPLADAVAGPASVARRLRPRGPGHRRDDGLRRRGQLQGPAGELQRVLPLRTCPPGALPARARVQRRREGSSTGRPASRTATAPGPSRPPERRTGHRCPASARPNANGTRGISSTPT